MSKGRLEELWERVQHIGKVEKLDGDAMLALGSVFGKMDSEIKKQTERVKQSNSIIKSRTALIDQATIKISRLKDENETLASAYNNAVKEISVLKTMINHPDLPHAYKELLRKNEIIKKLERENKKYHKAIQNSLAELKEEGRSWMSSVIDARLILQKELESEKE